MRALLRAAVLAVTGLLLVGLVPAPASAHGRGSDATNFRSAVTEAPDVAGVRWRVLGGDELLEVTVSGDREVVVLGHHGEPYLRIGRDGAFENRRSPTVPLHRERFRTEIPAHDHEPGELDPGAPPEWVRVSGEPRWAWHDHRIHWMAPRGPDVDGETVLIPRWEVPVVIDGAEAVVAGELRWVPPPPWWPWLLAGLALGLPALAGLRRPAPAREEAGGQPPPWPAAVRPACAIVAVVVALNGAHLVEDLSGWASLEERLFAAAQTALYLALALGGALRGLRGDYAGVTALAIGSGALFLGQGLLYLPVLGSSQAGVVVPEQVLRLAVGASLAQVLPVAGVVWRAGRAVQPPPPGEPAQAASVD